MKVKYKSVVQILYEKERKKKTYGLVILLD